MTLISKFLVDSDTSPVYHTDQYIHSFYDHSTNSVSIDKNNDTSIPKVTTTTNRFHLRTRKEVGKLGLLLVGLGGNNGSTVTASILANRHNVKWNTKEGIQTPNYYGSLLMSSTARIGVDSSTGEDIFTPLNSLLPMINVNDIAIDGWDINDMNLADALKRSCVLDYDLQNKLKPYLKDMVPWPSISYPEFIASNQEDRANNILPGTDKIQHLHAIRQNIRDFKDKHNLDNVIILWTATTEKYCSVINGVHDTALNLLTSIQNSHAEISPSTIFAVASILEGCSFINGSPQNTLVPGCIELANEKNVFVAGDDFKSGQTKFKSVMMDFLVGAGIKPRSIVSYNHLGNNDGKNLSEPKQFRSKEISKSNVVDDIVASNEILYPKQKVEQDSIKMNGNGTPNGTIISNGTTKKETVQQEHPDHEIVIKYVPSVGDSKRALDEYESDIFMNGRSTIVVHNTCEDSLLAAPLILDLAIMCELCQRITYKVLKPGEQVNLTDEEGDNEFERFEAVLSVLSYWLKAPMVPRGAPVVNALFKQRACIENLLRICAGLPAETDLRLEHRSSLLLPKANKHMNGNH